LDSPDTKSNLTGINTNISTNINTSTNININISTSTNTNSNTSGSKSEGNYEWLNYGLLYFGEEFVENIKKCPKTFELVNEIKSHINICGFSWMFGGCVLSPHTDITGLTSGSLAMHLGLVIPKPENACKIIIRDEEGEYMGINESDGKMLIFDATWEHYAYNLTNQDRLILYVDFKTM
jgi:aspartyl/asparaginyl beta-hydroxylase (cupin superfamily)